MITAKELFDKMIEENDECTSTEMMIEFAKIHVKEVLKQVSEKVKLETEYENQITPSILNVYSLDNIK